MNSGALIMNWILLIFLPWFGTFTASERIALVAAFLVLIGVAGEYLAEIPAIEERQRVRSWIKRASMALLLLGLTGDILGIVMGQAEMAALTAEAGDAARSARDAKADAKTAHDFSQGAVDLSGTALSQSGKATLQVKAVRSETTSLQRDQAVLRENALASGSRDILLVEHKNDNIASLKDFPRQEFELGVVCNAPLIELETHSMLARVDLVRTLLDATWIQEPEIPMGWSCNPGIWISVARNAPERTKLAASRLSALLKSELPEYRAGKNFTPVEQVQLILSPQDRFDTPSAPDVIRIRFGMHP